MRANQRSPFQRLAGDGRFGLHAGMTMGLGEAHYGVIWEMIASPMKRDYPVQLLL